MTNKLKCDVCGQPAAGVTSSCFGAESFAYCIDCISNGREVWGAVVGGLIGVKREEVAEWAKPVITATCAHYKKTEDELWAEVEKITNEYMEST